MNTVNHIKEIDSNLEGKLTDRFEDIFSEGETVGVKLHFGEPGNPHTFTPNFVKIFVKALQNAGTDPFLFDSPVVYGGPRNTVEEYEEVLREKSFDEESTGCPAVISNETRTFPGEKMDYRICTELTDCDSQLILTHLKGHLTTGFGGALKNIGMGGMGKKTKGLIHEGGEPEYLGGCTMCEACKENCPTDHIRYEDDRPRFDVSFCCGCSNCSYVCEDGALAPKVDYFDELLVKGVSIALEEYSNPYFVNCLINMAERCDCDPSPGPILYEDSGIVMGDDIVAVEKASYDILAESKENEAFEAAHHVSPMRHINIAQRLKMGDTDYKLNTL